MIRQSLLMFLRNLNIEDNDVKRALQRANEYSFHNQIRNELIMIPIPKAKLNKTKINFDQYTETQRNKIHALQKHCLKLAFNRVN